MKIAFGRNFKDTVPRGREMTFEQFVAFCRRQLHVGKLSFAEYSAASKVDRGVDKDSAWFIPAEFVRPERRANAVGSLAGLVCDFDDGAITRTEIETRLAAYAHVAWTSYSHGVSGIPRWRAFIPYASPITPQEHKAHYAYFNEIFEGHLDPRCATTSQLWYLPGHPRDAPAHEIFALVDGPYFVLPAVERSSTNARTGRLLGSAPVSVVAAGIEANKELSARAPASLRDIESALASLDTLQYGDYSKWLEIGMATFDGTKGSADGLDLFDTWSRRCPGYVEGTTEAKWQSFGGSRSGPRITVATLFKQAQEAGWTGSVDDTAGQPPVPAAAPAPAVPANQPAKSPQPSHAALQQPAQLVLPLSLPVTMPDKWRIDPKHNAMQRKEPHEETGGEQWVTRIRETRLTGIEMLEAIGGGPFGTCNLHFQCADKVRVVRLELALTSGSRDADFKSELFNNGVVVARDDAKYLQELIVDWLQKIKRESRVKKSLSHLGWLEDAGQHIGFACGTSAYYADGTEESDIQIAAAAGTLAPFYKPIGDITPWFNITKFLVGQKRSELLTILATAFASPLVKFSGVSGVVISLVSTASGVGKSSALMAAQAMWGDPKGTIHAASDTPLSLSKKMGFTRNLPAYWDDIKGEKTFAQFSELLFQITQGKEKSRLDQSANLRSIETWDCLAVVAANDSIVEIAKQYSNGSDAGVSRIFELRLEQRPEAVQSAAFFDGCRSNYGHAGAIYSKWLATNRQMAERAVIRTTERLSKELDMQSEERFWVATISCLVVGAAFAKHLGLVDFDPAALEVFLKRRFHELRGGKATIQHEQSAAPLIGDLIYDHQQSTLRIEALPFKNKAKVAIVRVPPGREVDLVVAEKNQILRIRKAKFNSWCQSRHHSPDTLRKKLEQLAAIVERNTDPMAGAEPYSQGSRTTCYDIDLKKLGLTGDTDDSSGNAAGTG